MNFLSSSTFSPLNMYCNKFFSSDLGKTWDPSFLDKSLKRREYLLLCFKAIAAMGTIAYYVSIFLKF